MPLTIDQQKFYEHLQQSHPIFFSTSDNQSHPDLAHLKTPAERYKNMCENYQAPKWQKN